MISDVILEKMAAVAREASRHAYCPYSGFRVGAALLTGSGEIISGCNVENVSFGLTICAERNAVFQAVARGLSAFRAIVVYTPTPTPAAPCGACRQVLNEFSPDTEVVCLCDGPGVLRMTVRELLPAAFGPKDLV